MDEGRGDTAAASVTAPDAVLFDFFGTLVRFAPVPVAAGYDRSYEVLRSLDSNLDYDDFATTWNACTAAREAEAIRTSREYSMDELVVDVLVAAGVDAQPASVDAVRRAFLAEWCRAAAVEPIDGVVELLGGLADRCRVAVVTNTHDRQLVPELLADHGLAPYVTETVMSVEVGYRKPHPAVFRAAVERLGVDPARCLFVGDSYEPDHAGPIGFGMRALLIDPAGTSSLPSEQRLESVLEVGHRIDPR